MVSVRVFSAACLSAALLTTTAAALVEGSCGPAGGVEDCQNVDFGTCGNACCRVEAAVEGSAASVVQALKSSLAEGGADGHYTLQDLFGGTLGFTALRDGSFIGQVHHMTSGPAHYNDTIDFHITASEDDKKTTIRAFSLSLIGGALGDSGQGYKNIILALQGAKFESQDPSLAWDGTLRHLDSSCPAPAAKKQQAPRPIAVEGSMLRERRLEKVVGSCGRDAKVTPDCQNKDLGSCGNACCSLKVTVATPPAESVVTLNESFANGGADGHYTPSLLAEGVTGFFDLSGKGVPGRPVIYIGQVIHTTSGVNHFNDSVNFNLVPSEDGASTIITAFSTSLIGGALGDNGQNYKNLKMAMDYAFPEGANIEPGNFPESCHAPTLV